MPSNFRIPKPTIDGAYGAVMRRVATRNERTRFNSAMGLASQGYSDVCELPLAVPSNA